MSWLTDEAIDEVDFAIALAHELWGAARSRGAGTSTPGVGARLSGCFGQLVLGPGDRDRRAWFVERGGGVGGAAVATGIDRFRVERAGHRGVVRGLGRVAGPDAGGGGGGRGGYRRAVGEGSDVKRRIIITAIHLRERGRK